MANQKNPCWCECDIECKMLYCEEGVECRFKEKVSFDWKHSSSPSTEESRIAE